MSHIKHLVPILLMTALGCGRALGEGREDMPSLPDQIEIPEEIMEAARQAKSNAVIQPEIQERVTTVMGRVNSSEWQQEKNRFLSAIREAQGLPEPEASEVAPSGARPLLFISSSMPEITLRNYVRDLEKVGGILVMRGMIGGMKRTQPTLRFISNLLKKDPSCEGAQCALREVEVVVDPIQFQKHGIRKVPALVVESEFDFQSYCEDGSDSLLASGPVVYGDASLSGLLNALASMTGGDSAKALLEMMEASNG